MTANQLQRESNRISQAVADEQARHNQAVEDETNRNNLEITRINDAANEIAKFKAQTDADYKEKSLEIDREYKEKYLQLQKAQGDEANRIKAELATIEQYKASVDQDYKIRMADIADQEAGIKQQIADETELHDRMIEDIQNTGMVLTRRQQDIQERYNKGMLQYYGGVLENQQIKVTNDYQLGLWNTQIGMFNVQLGLMNAKLNEKKYSLDIANSVFNGVAKLGGLVTGAAALLH